MPPGAARPASSNGSAVAALVLGILSLVLFWMCGLGVVLGVLAVVLGVVGLQRANKEPDRPQRGLAIGGIVTGGVAIVVSAVFFVAVFLIGASESEFEGINTDPSDGVCDPDRFMQDPDC